MSQDIPLTDLSISHLYNENKRLTDLCEEQHLTIEALLMGCKEHRLEGSTAVLTYIARLEDELRNTDKR